MASQTVKEYHKKYVNSLIGAEPAASDPMQQAQQSMMMQQPMQQQSMMVQQPMQQQSMMMQPMQLQPMMMQQMQQQQTQQPISAGGCRRGMRA